MAILRIPQAAAQLGIKRGKFYADVKAGVMVEPVNIGPRAVGVLASEVEAIIRARIRRASDDEVKALVQRLHAARMEGVQA